MRTLLLSSVFRGGWNYYLFFDVANSPFPTGSLVDAFVYEIVHVYSTYSMCKQAEQLIWNVRRLEISRECVSLLAHVSFTASSLVFLPTKLFILPGVCSIHNSRSLVNTKLALQSDGKFSICHSCPLSLKKKPNLYTRFVFRTLFDLAVGHEKKKKYIWEFLERNESHLDSSRFLNSWRREKGE